MELSPASQSRRQRFLSHWLTYSPTRADWSLCEFNPAAPFETVRGSRISANLLVPGCVAASKIDRPQLARFTGSRFGRPFRSFDNFRLCFHPKSRCPNGGSDFYRSRGHLAWTASIRPPLVFEMAAANRSGLGAVSGGTVLARVSEASQETDNIDQDPITYRHGFWSMALHVYGRDVHGLTGSPKIRPLLGGVRDDADQLSAVSGAAYPRHQTMVTTSHHRRRLDKWRQHRA